MYVCLKRCTQIKSESVTGCSKAMSKSNEEFSCLAQILNLNRPDLPHDAVVI